MKLADEQGRREDERENTQDLELIQFSEINNGSNYQIKGNGLQVIDNAVSSSSAANDAIRKGKHSDINNY